jgi:hypothetical protein
MPTVRVRPAPVLLVVGGSADFVRRCNEAAMQGRAIAVDTDLTTFTTLATQTRARAALMPAVTYATNAPLFEAIAKSAGTRLVTFSSESIDQAELSQIILGAVEAPADGAGPASRT